MASPSLEALDLKDLLRRIVEKLNDLTAILPVLGEIGVASIRQTFKLGGRYGSGIFGGGSAAWPESQRVKLHGGTTLIDDGILSGSTTYKLDGPTTLVFLAGGPAEDYAAAHQFGAKAGRGHKTTLIARPFMVLQDSDISEMLAVILEYYSDLLAGMNVDTL